jgi:hypothetical protein
MVDNVAGHQRKLCDTSRKSISGISRKGGDEVMKVREFPALATERGDQVV